jgi:hypothetical protein
MKQIENEVSNANLVFNLTPQRTEHRDCLALDIIILEHCRCQSVYYIADVINFQVFTASEHLVMALYLTLAHIWLS